MKIPFRPITLNDRDMITRLIQASDHCISDFSFCTIMAWSPWLKTEFAIVGESLLIRFNINGSDRQGYMIPVGRLPLEKAVDMLRQDAQSNGSEFCICGITQKKKEELEQLFPDNFSYWFGRDECDYLYSRDQLEKLTGRSLQPKRNYINQFKRKYNYRYIPVTYAEVSECIALAEWWYSSNVTPENIAAFDAERQTMTFMLNHLDELGAVCGAISVDGKIIAFSIGAPINAGTFVVSIEKANTGFVGAYALINQEFTAHLPSQVLYINREEDMGIDGLRKAKLSYHPIEIIKEYTAILTP